MALLTALNALVNSVEGPGPIPAFFAAVLARLGDPDPATVLYVGDRVDNDVLPALEAGLRVCWVRRGPWGQLQDLPDGVAADLSLEGLGELPELLAAWRDGRFDEAEVSA